MSAKDTHVDAPARGLPRRSSVAAEARARHAALKPHSGKNLCSASSRHGLVVALLVLVAACSPTPLEDRTPVGQTHVYRCADGFRFVVRFEPQRAWLFFDGTTKSVPQIPTRSGLLYTNRKLTFAKDGEEARLTMEGAAPAEHVKCVNQPAEAEHALK